MYIYFNLFYIALSILIILYFILNDVCCNTTNKLPEILSKILPKIIFEYVCNIIISWYLFHNFVIYEVYLRTEMLCYKRFIKAIQVTIMGYHSLSK